MKQFKPSFVPATLWLLISTILLTLPGSAFPKEDWTSKIWLDKWIHLGMFAGMTFLWCWALLRVYAGTIKLKKAFLIVTLLTIAYGVAMEFVQRYFIVNRSFDMGDIIADAAGSIAGYFLSSYRYIKK